MDKNNALYKSIRSQYHLLQSLQRIRKEYDTNCEYWGRAYAALCSDYEKANIFSTDPEKKLTAFQKKASYIRQLLTELIDQKKIAEENAYFEKVATSIPRMIWVYWWDGFDSAPEIVKACVASIKKAAGTAQVLFLDKENYEEYVQLPEDIVQKHDKGIIGHAHFSDIVRLSLLAKHGGLWMDATLFCSQSIPNEVWSERFYTCKQEEEDPMVPSRLRWAGWLLGGAPEFPLFTFSRDLLISYWRKYDSVIDYLLMDYVFDMAYERIPEVKEAIDLLPGNNPQRHELMKRINEPFDESFFNAETFVYKLSYRYGNPRCFTREGKTTFYGHITRGIRQQKLLVISGPISPLNSTNSNLMCTIVSSIPNSKVVWLSVGPYENGVEKSDLSPEIDVVRYSTLLKSIVEYPRDILMMRVPRIKQAYCHMKGRLADRNGYGEGADCFLLAAYVDSLHAYYHFDTIFACTEPFAAGYAMAFCKAQTKKALYLIDPPATIVPGLEQAVTPFRGNWFSKVISQTDLIITTDRIMEALGENAFPTEEKKVVCAEFPLIAEPKNSVSKNDISFSEKTINLLYCGWLRNADFFLKIIERLDDRFCVTFLGNDNDSARSIKTKAEIRTFHQTDRKTAINAIMNADILVSIGNPYPVHIPSKTFDYISSGKPILHFYSIPDCPALGYYKDYPIALCISDWSDVSEAIECVVNFCVRNKGKREAWKTISELYHDKLAEQTVKQIVGALTEGDQDT